MKLTLDKKLRFTKIIVVNEVDLVSDSSDIHPQTGIVMNHPDGGDFIIPVYNVEGRNNEDYIDKISKDLNACIKNAIEDNEHSISKGWSGNSNPTKYRYLVVVNGPDKLRVGVCVCAFEMKIK